MSQVATVWSALGTRKRVIVGLAALAAFGAVLLISRMSTAPDMALLYANLEDGAAGEVVSALEARGAEYEVRGTAIFVESAQRDELRLTLAGEGLPSDSGQGYELLDGLSGFGTTSQMFDAAYWRAKEGELARTLLAGSWVRAARVHISNQPDTPFGTDADTTAAVTLTTSGGAITAAQIEAVQHLVASAVSGLSPGDVAVIDSRAGLVSADGAAMSGAADGAEQAALRKAIIRLLEARVGPGNAVVEIALSHVRQSETIVERLIDPASRVAISSESEESTTSSNGSDGGGGAVTVASNLPDGEGGGAGESRSSNQSSDTRETTNYEVSETQREVVRGPGAVARLTVAVLVNGLPAQDPDAETDIIPRSREELAELKELVASAVGFDAERGDVITIKSMAFEALPALGTEATVAPARPLDIMRLIQLAVLALVAIVVALFVVRPILASARRPSTELPPPTEEPKALQGQLDPPAVPARDGQLVTQQDAAAIAADPVTRLRAMIEDRQDETVQILRDWIETPDGKGTT